MCCPVGMGCRVSSLYLLPRSLDTDGIRKLTEVAVRAFCHQRMLRSGRHAPRGSGEPSQTENFFTCKWKNGKTTLVLKVTENRDMKLCKASSCRYRSQLLPAFQKLKENKNPNVLTSTQLMSLITAR